MNVLSLRQAGQHLKIDPKIVKGMALGMGLPLTACSGRLFLSHEDFHRLKTRYEDTRKARSSGANTGIDLTV
jgi:hypothetical protein